MFVSLDVLFKYCDDKSFGCITDLITNNEKQSLKSFLKICFVLRLKSWCKQVNLVHHLHLLDILHDPPKEVEHLDPTPALAGHLAAPSEQALLDPPGEAGHGGHLDPLSGLAGDGVNRIWKALWLLPILFSMEQLVSLAISVFSAMQSLLWRDF